MKRGNMSILEKAYEARSKKVNKVETTKGLKNPMDVHAKLEEIAAAGYEGLAKEDSAYFLKCFGLFDKGEDFMLRVRVPAGQLNYEQTLRIGEVAKKYGNDYIDITTRMQIELRYLQIEDIAKVLAELQEVGISTFQTGVDNPRNIVTDPLDGLAYDNIIETKPLINKMQDIFAENPDWISVLPRKFNTGILGSMSNSCNIFGHDCCFILAQKEGAFGFNIHLGARVGMQAQDSNLFVKIDEVPRFFEALLTVFKNYGYRDNRNKNRLVFLLNDVGMENFIDAIKEESGLTFTTAGISMVQSHSTAMGSNKVLLRNGTFAYKLIVPSGIFTGTDMMATATLAKSYGTGDVRLSYDQNIHIVNLPQESIDTFETTEIVSKYAQYDNLYFNDMIACAGTATCSFGVIPNKPDAIDMANFLKHEIPIENAMVRMNWSACPKGCGVHGIADIGLEGCKAKDDEGNRVDGVHIFLGGKITKEAKEAHTLHKSVPIKEAKHHVKYLLKAYAEHKQLGESFEAFDDRFLSANYSFQALSFYTKINYVLNEMLGLKIFFDLDEYPKNGKKEDYEIFNFGLKLFKLLTGEKRFVSVTGLEPDKIKPRKIKRDEVHQLNANVPKELSEVIYNMTHEKRQERCQVFSEILVALKGIEKKKYTPIESFLDHQAQTGMQCGNYSIDVPELKDGEQYRFHFDATVCVGCHCCEAACNELQNNPADIKWRRVGEMEGGEFPHVSQLFNSMSCNHCIEPECLIGCPTNSYIKFEDTGIVFHDDDVCIGCHYCTWNCPYEVPIFNPDRGIVTKCDMCHDKLAVGETPACVQACPAGAIEIEVVNKEQWLNHDMEKEGVAPHLPDVSITKPTTRYTLPDNMPEYTPVNEHILHPASAELPLVFMTVLTQISLGAFLALFLGQLLFSIGFNLPEPTMLMAIVAFLPTAIGLPLSALHLGRPFMAMTAMINWRTSWLSREAIALAVFSLLSSVVILMYYIEVNSVVLLATETITLLFGIFGIYAQSRIYRVKARPSWNQKSTTTRFFGSGYVGFIIIALILMITDGQNGATILLSISLLAGMIQSFVVYEEMRFYDNLDKEHPLFYQLDRTRTLLNECFTDMKKVRIYSLVLSALILPLFSIVFIASGLLTWAIGTMVLATIFALSSELMGRYLFYRTVVPLGLAGNFFAGNQRH